MSRKQWIWLIAAVLVFAAAGTLSVVTNTWAQKTAGNIVETAFGSLPELYAEDSGDTSFPADPFIARIDVEGVIVSSGSVTSLASTGFDMEYILDYIDRLTDCPQNAGILLYINSGGGEIGASDEVYLKLLDYKAATGRPVYAYFDQTACSGAYYIAMAADEIWANRNSLCVNIGVYIETYNLSGLFEKYGIEEVMIKSSDNKGIGAVGQPWTEEQRAIYQSIVDLYYDQFLEVVADGRGMTKDTVRALDDGREMLALQALQAGFIDGIGRFEEYQERLAGYYGGDILIYEEEPVQPDLLTTLLRDIYGKLEALTPRSEVEILRGLMDDSDGIVVMAYAG
ncbi:MAG: signal peptide peptidase SppA [Oscillospiraceae bacterium]